MAITVYIEGEAHPDGFLSERSYLDVEEIKDVKENGDFNWQQHAEAQTAAKKMMKSGCINVTITQHDSQAGYGNPYSAIEIRA